MVTRSCAPSKTEIQRYDYAYEAIKRLAFKILNKTVKIEYDKDEPTYGNYGRSLAYIWLNNTHINSELIRLDYI